MECLIWVSEKAEASRRDERDEEDQSETDEEQSIFEDGILKENEKEELRALSLDEAMAENPIPCSRENERSQDVTEVTDGDLEDSQSGDVIHVLNNQLRQLEPESLRHRQVSHILQTESSKKDRAHHWRQKQHEQPG